MQGFTILPLIFAVSSSFSFIQEEFHMQNCEKCFLSTENFFHLCAVEFCEAEFANRLSLESRSSSLNPPCLSCSTHKIPTSYKSCLLSNCKAEITSLAFEFAAKGPFSLDSPSPVLFKNCEECMSSSFTDSIFAKICYSSCKLSLFTKQNLLSQANLKANTLCGLCTPYKSEEFSNCAFIACKAEIFSLSMSLLNPEDCRNYCATIDVRPFFSYEKCMDECALREKRTIFQNEVELTTECEGCSLIFKEDIEKLKACQAEKCRNKGIGAVELSGVKQKEVMTVSAKCRECEKYYNEGYLYEYQTCIDWYCSKHEIKDLELYNNGDIKLDKCKDCEKFWDEGRYDEYNECVSWYCREKRLGNVKFKEESAKSKAECPRVILDKCEKCAGKFKGEALNDCVFMNCRDKIEKNFGIELVKHDCLKLCDRKEDSFSCFSSNCREEVMDLYKNHVKAVAFMEDFTSDDRQSCKSARFDYYEFSFAKYFCYESAIINKSSLFSMNSPLPITSLCAICKDTPDYPDCIYSNCRQELIEKSRSLVLYNIEQLTEKIPIKAYKCPDCLAKYGSMQNDQAYHCAFYNCRKEAVSREVLFGSNEPVSLSCMACSNFDGDNYSNCVFWYCKSEISEKVERLYSGKKITNCVEGCYSDWEFFDENYGNCVKNCRVSKIDSDLFVVSKSNMKNLLEFENWDRLLCFSKGKKCINDSFHMGQHSFTVYSSQNCEKSCAVLYKNEESWIAYSECMKISCKNEFSLMSQALLSRKSEFINFFSGVSLNTCELCFSLYREPAVYDCAVHMCKEKILASVIRNDEGSGKMSMCKPCIEFLTGDYDESQLYACSVEYCKQDVSVFVDQMSQSMKKLEIRLDKLMFTDEECTQFYENPAFGYEYSFCTGFYADNGFDLMAALQKTELKIGFSYPLHFLLVLIIGFLLYASYMKNKKPNRKSLNECQTSYRILT